MRLSPLSLPFLLILVVACPAQDVVESLVPAGPALVYEEAFPAQELFERPLFVAFHATDPDSAYVVTQTGQVLRIPRDGAKSDREVFLDLGGKVFVNDNWEEGLLGFQFDPGYAENGLVYVCWSEQIEAREEPMARGKRKSNRQSVISRFGTVEKDGRRVVDPATELRLMQVFQPFGNHNGGTILFGPDRMLYVALGDGGAANDPYGNAESLQMLLGKVLRIDVRGATTEQPYAIPKDNPFVDTPDARGEIWCYGLRNVWRMAFDRETRQLWAGDVGQDRIEEVDVLVRGGFYGWNSFEADERFGNRRSPAPTPEGHIPPVASYPHKDGLSITGGCVYRGARIPALAGYFVYGDFMTKRMWACDTVPSDAGHRVVTLPPVPCQPTSFVEEPDGEVLMTGFVDKDRGKILRLVAPPK